MSDKSRRSEEDIAGLFAAFGGDVGRYQEFDKAVAPEPSPNWTLLQQLGADPQATPAPLTAAAAAARTPPAPQSPPTPVFPAAAEPAAPTLARAFAADPAFKAEPVFSPAAPPVPATPVWPPPEAQPPSAHAFFAPAAPSPAPAQPAQDAPAPPPGAAADGAPTPPGTPLRTLFERLASAPTTDAQAGRSLMAHWRQSG